jgi:hypothetical protein
VAIPPDPVSPNLLTRSARAVSPVPLQPRVQLPQRGGVAAVGGLPVHGLGGGGVPGPLPQPVVHDGKVVINDPAVTAGRVIEVCGGHVEITTEAADAATQIIVRGGQVALGRSANSRSGLKRFLAA